MVNEQKNDSIEDKYLFYPILIDFIDIIVALTKELSEHIVATLLFSSISIEMKIIDNGSTKM
jgi:hypothetical protein